MQLMHLGRKEKDRFAHKNDDRNETTEKKKKGKGETSLVYCYCYLLLLLLHRVPQRSIEGFLFRSFFFTRERWGRRWEERRRKEGDVYISQFK